MLAVGLPEAVAVVVGRVEPLAREDPRHLALLELDGVRAALARALDEALRYLDVALVYDIFGFVGILALVRYFAGKKEVK